MPVFRLPYAIPTSSFTVGTGSFSMTTYTGFDPGTYQPWSLNLQQNALGQAGVARGMVVGPTAPASMNVNVAVDGIKKDGICFVPSGGWLRIDGQVQLSVPNNSSGQQRTDAVVAYVDPTGTSTSGLYYLPNWTLSYSPTDVNQLVVALVSVPNGASSIITANIAQTNFQGDIGTAPPTVRDSIVSDDSPGAQQPRIFSQYNVVLSASAGNGQTAFSANLGSTQRLVATGRIGGADEVGYFAGPQGWYVPKLFGSVSGNLPVASVNIITGVITSGLGAQSGETVYASYKVYDFGRDLNLWAGSILLQRNSPYIVYQGDLHASTLHVTNDVWDGTLNGVSPATSGMSIVITYYGRDILPHFAAATSGVQVSYSFDGNAPSTVTLPYSADVGPASTGINLTPGGNNDAVHQLTLTFVSGLADFAGVDVACFLTTVYLDGGQAVVDGFTVNVASTSFQLFPPNQGYASIFSIDRYGNTTASSRTMALPMAEAIGQRVPISQAVRYVSLNNATTMFGSYALPGSPKGLPTYVILGSHRGGLSAIPPTSSISNGWTLVADPTSPVGGVFRTNSTQDGFMVIAPMTGLDLISTAAATTTLSINIDNTSTFTTFVPPSIGAARVRTTLASSWPVGSHSVKCFVSSAAFANFAWSPEFVELRYPELPTSPAGTLPLAAILSLPLFNGGYLTKGTLHDAQFNGGSGTFQVLNDLQHHGMSGPNIWVANTSTNQSYVQTIHTSGAFRVHFMENPTLGIFNVVVDGISTYATIDSYQTFTSPVTSAPILLPTGGIHTVACVATGTKNTSSSGVAFIIEGIDYLPPENVVLDATAYGPDGLRPSIRGSALFSQTGEKLHDVNFGISTLHLQDRGVSSRKMTPTYNRVIATTQQSNINNVFDTGLAAGVVVEVPSLLWVDLTAVLVCPNANGAAAFVSVDGALYGVNQGSNQGSSDAYVPLHVTDLIPVGPGSHTVQAWYTNAGFAKNPYINAGLSRQLTVVAFAL